MWYNPIIKVILISPLHGLVDPGIMLVTYTGKKTGKTYSVPISYVVDGSDLLTVTFKRRTWWRSFKTPSPVTVRWKGRKIPATAEAVYQDPVQVAQDLNVYLDAERGLARHMHIEIGDDGKLNPEQLLAAAQSRVMVRFHMQKA